MKVLHILDHSVPLFSGYSFRSRSIINAQRELGLKPVVLTSPKHSSNADAAEEIEGITYYRSMSFSSEGTHSVPFVREMKLMMRMARRIEQIGRHEKIDLIHSHSPLLNGLPALWVARRLGIPLLYEARAFWEDAAVDHGTFAEDSFRYGVSRELETFLFRRTDHAVTICEAMRREVQRRGVPADHISVVPNGVNIDEFRPIERCQALSVELGLKGGPVLGFIGSFYHYEGLRFLLDVFPRIRERVPGAELLLVGGGEEEEILRELARGLSGVHFTGRVPHEKVTDYYSLIDIFVCPRLRMRLTELVTPLKPLESMAMRKAVLASDVGGHQELIEHGKTGWFFSAENAEDMIWQTIRLAEDANLRMQLGDRGRRFVAEERSWETLSRRYIDLYDKALAAKNKRVPASASVSEQQLRRRETQGVARHGA